MTKSNLLYFIIGILFVVIILLSINAVSGVGNKYEHHFYPGVPGALSILDTDSGVVKIYSITGKNINLVSKTDFNAE